MKQIKIAFPGLQNIPTVGLNTLIEGFDDKFEFDVCKNPSDADFVAITGFASYHEVLDFCEKYQDKIIIARTGEACFIDFNLIDYGIGFDEQIVGDRYFRPFITCCWLFPSWVLRLAASIDPEAIKVNLAQKTGFCNFIYSSANAHASRDVFFHQLSTYRKVDSLGRHLKNCETPLPECRWWEQEFFDFKGRYKFSIAFENATHPGYNSEKIATSMFGDTIPIYWGDPSIATYYNPKSFINCHDYKNFEQVIEKVKELDSDDEKYLEMLQQPWLTSEQIKLVKASEMEYRKWVENIFSQPYEQAFRKPTGWMNNTYRTILSKASKPSAEGFFTNASLSKLARVLKKYNSHLARW